MEKEIEIKFKIDENILSRLGAVEMQQPYEEIDEYFFTQETFDNDTYLRFRKKNGKIFLNLKNVTVGGTVNVCYEADELSVEITEEQYQNMKKIFDVIFPIKVNVNKTRSKGIFNGCELCLDKVNGLGDFLEIEGPKHKILEACKLFNLDVEKRDKEKGYVKMSIKK